MSQVYSTEPQTTGRVILNTSHGPIDIHLWCKECPSTTRAFLQLCLDGFYDDMVFHRILDNFLIQTGKMKCNSNDSSIVDMDEYDDMNGANNDGADGGNAEKYWESTVLLNTSNDKAEFMTRKKLELNPRIRFNHRGQIAMALPLDYEMPSSSSKETDKEITSLARQFFITMDEAPYLQSKYVIFGTVTGDTIFNALRINRTNEGAQSTGGNSNNNDNSGNEGQVPDLQNAPKIQSIRIISHLFHDLNMTKGTLIPWNSMNKLGAGFIGLKKGQVSDVKKRRKKRKGKKDLNVLSFGAEMEDGDDFGMQSSHDVLQSHNSSNNNGNKKGKLDDHDNNASMTRPQITQTSQQQQQQQLKTNEMKHSPKIDTGHEHNDSTNNSTNDTDIDTHHKGDEAVTTKSSSHESSSSYKQKSTSTSISDSNINNRNSNNNNKKPKLSAIEARKLKYLTKSTTRTGIAKETYYKQSKQRDEKTMNKLLEFKSKMFQIKQRSDTTSSTAAAVGEVDNSLASRMARREQQQQQQQTKSNQSSSVPVYSGQILDDDDDDGHDQLLEEKSWLKHRFKCKRHVDHESKDLALGGDGRNAMEEYEVIDYQKGGREHGREHGGGRSHDSLNNSRSGKRQHPKGSRSNYSRKHY